MNTVAVIVGGILIIGGLSALVAGYDYYVTMKKADEEMQQLAEEMGLGDIPGVYMDVEVKIGIAASVAGAVVALVGGVVLAYGLLKKPNDVTTHPNLVPGATNFCEQCGRSISPNAASCPCCGRQIVSRLESP